MSLPLRRLGFFSFCALFLAVILSTLATVSAQSAPDSSTPESSFASQNPRGIPALADADGFQETSRRRLRRPHISEVKPDKAHQGQTNLNVAVTGQRCINRRLFADYPRRREEKNRRRHPCRTEGGFYEHCLKNAGANGVERRHHRGHRPRD